MDGLLIDIDDPRAADVSALLQRHLAFARSCTPPEAVFAIDIHALTQPSITFCSARRSRRLLGIGALKELDAEHGEVKSMHTITEARGQSVATALLQHLLELARWRGFGRVSLETGSQAEFAPARALYARVGFEVCGSFSDYSGRPTSTFMTIVL